MKHAHKHTVHIRIYHEFEVSYNQPDVLPEVVAQTTSKPEIFDYRCDEYAFRKLTETPQCQVQKRPYREEEEQAWCGSCGAAMTHVRPGKWQCDTCENLEVWMSAAKAMFGFLTSIEHRCIDGSHWEDDEFFGRLQHFRLGYANLCEPDDVEDES